MPDQSQLDTKYFIDRHVYNCPFCNRRNVVYRLVDSFIFDFSETRPCYGYIVVCTSCKKHSMHLSYTNLEPFKVYDAETGKYHFEFSSKGNLDSLFFYSVPTSYFVMDERIHRTLRELVTEAEGSLNMNFLTGASACTRKAIYELLVIEKATGADYEGKIKSLKDKYPGVDAGLFDVLAHIQDMTSDKVHEQSWPKWDSPQLRLILETLKAFFQEIYVVPAERKERSLAITQLREQMLKDKKPPATAPASSPQAERQV